MTGIKDFYGGVFDLAKDIVDQHYGGLTDTEKILHVVKVFDIILAVELRKGMKNGMEGMQKELFGKLGKLMGEK